MAPQKIIIDTDPGVDDMLALLLALSASPDELELLLISLTFGNINIENCLRNTVSLFHVLDLEKQWRSSRGLRTGFSALENTKPIVAIGADRPLEEQLLAADYFHGLDGLGGVHTTAPHFTPSETWSHIFNSTAATPAPPNFTPSSTPAHLEILRILAENPPNTITIIAVGPLTNISLAATHDLPTLLRAKEVIIMGGAIDQEGNVTPVAEFNHYACAYSAAHIYALTSPHPSGTLPIGSRFALNQAPAPEKPLKLSIFPLDITNRHLLSEAVWRAATADRKAQGSPLAQWCDVFVTATFKKMKEMYLQSTGGGGEAARRDTVDISMHDPLCVWYAISALARGEEGWVVHEGRDIRVEPAGQWTRGMCVVDRRPKNVEENLAEAVKLGDVGVWLHRGHGNRVRQVVESPEGTDRKFGGWMLERIFDVVL
ncbi:inosine-uridine preferring nucleoside hydrolase [Morchella conica CCBAS932]|uniref:Inosine-uridine preferring nucleoside hydrolase n=1 Tax=Morchella conica CCBAS932 TaxID=1392247 RepID=A0A3N4L768_9PEZI|nr:inosine-uridine preferring nucleoside hydrolase [Morchella conica CCBAS932]